ncbi:MAG: RNA-binding protein [Candidatus Kerfeldbacteria bacterium]|nr:RNA-binding protein [Candidatus Kerfeldbacteria bacterium]
MTGNLFVGGVSFKSTNETLQAAFAKAGTVVSAKIIMDRETGRSRGFAFVEMSTPQEAQAAIDMFNGQEIDGREVSVRVAEPRKQ